MKSLATIAAIVFSTSAVKAGDWSGSYIGLHAGYGSGASTYVVDIYPNLFFPYDPDGLFGGVYVGYNTEVRPGWILGVEADVSAGGIESGRTALFDPLPRTRDVGHSDVKWQSAFRARLGYDVGRLLPFATAGVAIAGYQHSVEDTYSRIFDSFNRTAVGWTIGAGFDYAITKHLIARAEYRYADFGTDHYAWNPGLALAHTVDLSLNDVRLGLAYKF